MNTTESIINAYDTSAIEYAASFWNEFDKKHFDRIMLNWYADQFPGDKIVLEIGCGPGEVSGYLSRFGVTSIGTDLSRQMIEQARKYFPKVQFEIQDFYHLTYADNTFDGAIAFYAIVNLQLPDVKRVLEEVKRVLKNDGLFLFTFHIHEGEGEAQTDVKEFFNKPGAELTFYYFNVGEMKALVENLGFEIVDILVRYPYQDVEYQSKRAYFLARKV